MMYQMLDQEPEEYTPELAAALVQLAIRKAAQ